MRRLDDESPIPLYHQIAEAIRYDISTGKLAPGSALLPLRMAAQKWRVNLHTVRHAYTRLAEGGYASIRPPFRAVVTGHAKRGGRASLDQFLERTIREARETHGLSPERLAALIGGRSRGMASPTVHVVECSDTQCEDLARQIEVHWNVRALPWCLGSGNELPAGDVVATYFHYNDVRRLAPKRLDEVRFVTIRPDPALASRVHRLVRGRARVSVALVERQESMARSIAADVSVLLEPFGLEASPTVVANAATVFAGKAGRRVLLFSPRMWGALTRSQRRDPRALEVRYVIDTHDMAALGAALGWTAPEARRQAAPAGESR